MKTNIQKNAQIKKFALLEWFNLLQHSLNVLLEPVQLFLKRSFLSIFHAFLCAALSWRHLQASLVLIYTSILYPLNVPTLEVQSKMLPLCILPKELHIRPQNTEECNRCLLATFPWHRTSCKCEYKTSVRFSITHIACMVSIHVANKLFSVFLNTNSTWPLNWHSLAYNLQPLFENTTTKLRFTSILTLNRFTVSFGMLTAPFTLTVNSFKETSPQPSPSTLFPLAQDIWTGSYNFT